MPISCILTLLVIYHGGLFQMSLCGDQLSLRRAAVSCLRQLAQREAHQVCRHAASLAGSGSGSGSGSGGLVSQHDSPGKWTPDVPILFYILRI